MTDTIKAFTRSLIGVGQPVKLNRNGTVSPCEFDDKRFIGITMESAEDGVAAVLVRGRRFGTGIPPIPDVLCLGKDVKRP
jgi:hypothetical protein